MRKRAFTLIELLVVIAIIAILAAVFMPVIASVKKAAFQYSALQSLRQIGQADLMYVADNEETFPLALYQEADGLHMWMGKRGADGQVDPSAGLLYPYIKTTLKDKTFKAKDYLGDQSGFGYNWGYLGSDFNVTGNYWGFPNCSNAANITDIAEPAKMIAFSTSALFNAPWQPNGDSAVYDFGFIDPPKYWHNNPNMDFRHQGERHLDLVNRKVNSTGMALVVHVDGHADTIKQDRVKDSMFERGELKHSGDDE